MHTTYIAHKKLMAYYQFLSLMYDPVSTGHTTSNSRHITQASTTQALKSGKTHRQSTYYKSALTSTHKDMKHNIQQYKAIKSSRTLPCVH